MLRSYKELKVWQRSFHLCKQVYDLSRAFPADERFGLVAQMRRAVISIPSNVAEGHSRDTTRDYLRFLWMAKGSVAELETQTMLAQELGFTDLKATEPVLKELNEIGRMLRGLIQSLDTDRPRPTEAAEVASLNPQSSILNPEHA